MSAYSTLVLSVTVWVGNLDLFGHQGVEVVFPRVCTAFEFTIVFVTVNITTVMFVLWGLTVPAVRYLSSVRLLL